MSFPFQLKPDKEKNLEEKFVLEDVMKKVWKEEYGKIKTNAFFLFFAALDIQRDFFHLFNDYQFRNENIHHAIELI